MALTIMNSVSALTAENALSNTQANLTKTLTQLSTGLKINSGADDAAGLSIVTGISANMAALTQSQQNSTDSIGLLQTADGALSQVSTLLNRAVTLATEASTSGLTTSQATALQTEYQSIQDEIDQINSNTNFNGQNVFSIDDVAFVGDGTSGAATSTISTDLTATTVTANALGLSANTLTTTTGAEAVLTSLAGFGGAIDQVAAFRGTIGSSINRLTSANNVMANQVTNLQSAQNSIQDADIAKTVANMTQYDVLQSTGMSALQQSNQAQQAVLKLVQ